MAETLSEAEKVLVNTWLSERHPLPYIEPVLDSTTVSLIKFACDTLKQDAHVFVMSVDVVTRYIHAMNDRERKISDQLVIVLSVIGIGSKYVGELSELKFNPIAKLYELIVGKKVAHICFQRAELSVLDALKDGLPVSSVIDDVKALACVYTKKFNLRVDIMGLCVDVLTDVYVYYRRLFKRLKAYYNDCAESADSFQTIVTNRFYLPSGVLLVGFKMTKLRNMINLKNLAKELCAITGVKESHLELLAQYIVDLIKENS